LFELHDSVVVPPEETDVGVADRLIVGGLCPPELCPEEPAEPPPPPHAAIDRVVNSRMTGRAGRVLNNVEKSVSIGRIRPS
jgi:hypothetical protein